MSAFKNYVVSQFGHPRGLVGTLVGHAMAIKNRERIDWAVSLLEVQATDRVLEIGFGPGVALRRIAERAPDGLVAGLEVSELMIEQASRRLVHEIATGHAELRHGSVSSLPFANATFDKALAINTMMFWPDAVAGLHEIFRTLRPGGLVLVVRQPHGARDESAIRRVSEDLRAKLEEACFVDCSVQQRRMRPVTCVAVSGTKPWV